MDPRFPQEQAHAPHQPFDGGAFAGGPGGGLHGHPAPAADAAPHGAPPVFDGLGGQGPQHGPAAAFGHDPTFAGGAAPPFAPGGGAGGSGEAGGAAGAGGHGDGGGDDTAHQQVPQRDWTPAQWLDYILRRSNALESAIETIKNELRVSDARADAATATARNLVQELGNRVINQSIAKLSTPETFSRRTSEDVTQWIFSIEQYYLAVKIQEDRQR